MALFSVRQQRPKFAFTLIELLVVVAIIAILISILLPSLSAARNQARAVQCASNNRQVGTAVASYLAENRGIYPVSYVYLQQDGSINFAGQPNNPQYGYAHWSWFLYNRGQAGDKAFTCPTIPNGGHPRTFPGPRSDNWNSGQVDGNAAGSQQTPTVTEDKQARRIAFTANAAIMPRNKFTTQLSNGPRINQFVPDSKIKRPADVILVTEFNRSWIAQSEGPSGASNGPFLSKAHRPVNPFYSLSSGADEFGVALNTPTYTYARDEDRENSLLRPLDQIESTPNVIGGALQNELNAIGRHHPGGQDRLGGAANFQFADGHVDRLTVRQTIKNRLWGDTYWAITGRNEVLDVYGDIGNQ